MSNSPAFVSGPHISKLKYIFISSGFIHHLCLEWEGRGCCIAQSGLLPLSYSFRFIIQVAQLSPIDGGECSLSHSPAYWHSTDWKLFFHTSALNCRLCL